jgi:hypothetical protein
VKVSQLLESIVGEEIHTRLFRSVSHVVYGGGVFEPYTHNVLFGGVSENGIIALNCRVYSLEHDSSTCCTKLSCPKKPEPPKRPILAYPAPLGGGKVPPPLSPTL